MSRFANSPYSRILGFCRDSFDFEGQVGTEHRESERASNGKRTRGAGAWVPGCYAGDVLVGWWWGQTGRGRGAGANEREEE